VRTMDTPDRNDTAHQHDIHRLHRWFPTFFRFAGWWLAFAGIYVSFSVCPFCGQQGCPVGLGTAGVFGAAFSLLLNGLKHPFAFLRRCRTGISGSTNSSKLRNSH
jgi:hypothetical protein